MVCIFSVICAYTISSNFAHAYTKHQNFSTAGKDETKNTLTHSHTDFVNKHLSLSTWRAHTHLIVCNKIKMPDNSWVYIIWYACVCVCAYLSTCHGRALFHAHINDIDILFIFIFFFILIFCSSDTLLFLCTVCTFGFVMMVIQCKAFVELCSSPFQSKYFCGG